MVFNPLDLDYRRVIQLVVIIGGYIIVRQRFVAYMKTKSLDEKLEKDKAIKTRKLIQRPEDLPSDPISVSEMSWGWGKPTRKKMKTQEKLLEERIREAAEKTQGGDFTADNDDDIADLLIE
ncbi:hypothetical protein FOA43_000697 [Brettanomyces nanus]|uniref:Uncharacterized protein n=1 Tax=Eeniella nana TaxID=13502 RepID=A0A875RTD7_EENNA|nr:uncharacterized protein FOA43_000697 [Brettanomyces nanus]QPG73387.1 hypothetical protein FOA43_000697 [Brettanomyces nanus]